MAPIPPQLKKRQITLGIAIDGFEAVPQSPNSNNVDVGAGVLSSPSPGEIFLPAVQAVGPFLPVSAPGRIRWDLVYLDAAGVAQIEAGVEQIAPVPAYTGAPGNGTALAAPDALPVAYIEIDESAAVLVDSTDISDIRGSFRLLEKGVVGELQADDNTGAGGVLGTVWKQSPIDHRHPPNVGAANPADIVPLVPVAGISEVYTRDDHVHALGAVLLNSLATPMDRGSSCFWTPRTHRPGNINTSNYHWILHQFQGRAANDPLVWFNINRGSEATLALFNSLPGGNNGGDGALGVNVQLGGSDETNPAKAAFQHSWLYVYLIGDPSTGVAALVYSTSPPTVGPVIGANPVFAGYTAWRVVTCIEGAISSIAVPAVKKDNTVLKLFPTGYMMYDGSVSPNVGGHTVTLYWGADTNINPLSLAEHCSPLSMAVYLNIFTFAEAAAGGGFQGCRCMLQRSVLTALSPDEIADADPDQIKVTGCSATGVNEHDQNNEMVLWLLAQDRSMRVAISDIDGGSDTGRVCFQILGYIENSDIETASWDFTL